LDDSTTTIQVTLHLWPIMVGLVLLPLTVAAAFAALRKTPPTLSRDLLQRFGVAALPSGLVVALGLLWLVLFTTFTLGILWVIGSLLWNGPAMTPDDAPDYRWHLLTLTALTASLAAVVALPFTLLRTGYAARQTRTAEENLTTDLINKAVEGLGAQKEVNQLGRTFAYTLDGRRHTVFETVDERSAPPDGATEIDYQDWQNVALTLPNIEVRLGAIYALERIAQDSPRDHIRVMEILCAYIRENVPTKSLAPTEPGNNFTAKRTDIQTAIDVIGRRSDQQIALEIQKEYRLDFSQTDLSQYNFNQGNFSGAIFEACRLEATNFTRAKLRGAIFFGSIMNFANFMLSDLSLARFDKVKINLPEDRVGAFSNPLALAATIKGASLAGADLTAINTHEGDPVFSETFGTKDTQFSDLSSFSLQSALPEIARLTMEKRRLLKDDSNPPRLKEIEIALSQIGFRYYVNFGFHDMAREHCYSKMLEELALKPWPRSEGNRNGNL
jgi:hypothetical protein